MAAEDEHVYLLLSVNHPKVQPCGHLNCLSDVGLGGLYGAQTPFQQRCLAHHAAVRPQGRLLALSLSGSGPSIRTFFPHQP